MDHGQGMIGSLNFVAKSTRLDSILEVHTFHISMRCKNFAPSLRSHPFWRGEDPCCMQALRVSNCCAAAASTAAAALALLCVRYDLMCRCRVRSRSLRTSGRR